MDNIPFKRASNPIRRVAIKDRQSKTQNSIVYCQGKEYNTLEKKRSNCLCDVLCYYVIKSRFDRTRKRHASTSKAILLVGQSSVPSLVLFAF